tara:strand:+ start:397 stop:525 length:129 start_codon:yes stop_codon:yes gene_type:complete
MTFEDYIKEELKYYDEHPEEDDTLEAHSNSMVAFEMEFTSSS